MRRVKETVHYFCNDILFGHIDGHGVTTAVLDTGIFPAPGSEGEDRGLWRYALWEEAYV